MNVTLENGYIAEIKVINIIAGQVDYRITNSPVYSGDCVLYIQITDLATALADIKTALDLTYPVKEPA
jgi:hypothetical protein